MLRQRSLLRGPLLSLRSFFIKTEPTPNPNSLIFRPDRPEPLLPPDTVKTFDFTSPLQAARSSPLADELFNIEGVRGVLLGKDFLTVTRDPKGPTWAQLNPQVYAAIMDFIHSGKPVLSGSPEEAEPASSSDSASEAVAMIREILDTRIRPTVQQDGGDIQYRGFDSSTGFVKLQLTGACRSCSSSTITLRNGIEAMLMHYIPEVKGVEQVLDEADQAAQQAFDAFEHGKEGEGK